MSKVSRLLAVLSALESGRTVSAPELARRVGVTERTLRRDIAELRGEGYRIDADSGPAGGYTLMRGTRLPPLLFDEEQVLALAIALQVMPPIDGVADGAERALVTLRQLLPSRLAAVVDRHRLNAARPAGDRVDAATLAGLSSAMNQGIGARFDYSKPGTDTPERRHVEPHHVLYYASHWYLIGWDLDRDDWRVFRVDRLRLHDVRGRPFARRTLPNDPATHLKRLFEDPDWPCTGSVLLHAPADYVTRWAQPGWIVEEIAPDRVRVAASAWTWVGLLAWLSEFDVDFDIEGPDELNEAATVLAARLTRARGD